MSWARPMTAPPAVTVSSGTPSPAADEKLAREVAELEARITAARSVVAGDLPRPPYDDFGPEEVPEFAFDPYDFEAVRRVLTLRDPNAPRIELDLGASVAELRAREQAARPIVEALDATIAYHAARRDLLDPYDNGADVDYAFPTRAVERALAGIFPLYDDGRRLGAIGRVERVEGHVAVRDIFDGRLYALREHEPEDVGRTVCATVESSWHEVNTGGYDAICTSIDDVTLHRMHPERVEAFLAACKAGEIPEPESGGVQTTLRRALASYVDLSQHDAMLAALAADGRPVQTYDAGERGRWLGIDEACVRRDLRHARGVGKDAETLPLVHLRTATARDAYVLGYDDAADLRRSLEFSFDRVHAPTPRATPEERIEKERREQAHRVASRDRDRDLDPTPRPSGASGSGATPPPFTSPRREARSTERSAPNGSRSSGPPPSASSANGPGSGPRADSRTDDVKETVAEKAASEEARERDKQAQDIARATAAWKRLHQQPAARTTAGDRPSEQALKADDALPKAAAEQAALGINPIFDRAADGTNGRNEDGGDRGGRSDVGGTVVQAGDYLAVRDERDGLLYAFEHPGAAGDCVYIVAPIAGGGDDAEIHRIPKSRENGFLLALTAGTLPEPSVSGVELRRALAEHVNLTSIATTLDAFAAEKKPVHVWEVAGYGDTLAVSEAAARGVLPQDERKAACVAYVGVATATDAYAAGFTTGEELRAEILALEARATPEPTRLIDLGTLETDLENREREDAAPVSEVERTRRNVLMRGLTALGVGSLAVGPEKMVENLTARAREVEVAAMRALAEMRAPRSQTEPEHEPTGPGRPSRSPAPSRTQSPTASPTSTLAMQSRADVLARDEDDVHGR